MIFRLKTSKRTQEIFQELENRTNYKPYVTIDNYNYLKQGIAEADKILEDLDLDEDSEILAFLKLVSEGKATILNLTDEILAWIKAENLADKMFINF